MLIRRLIASLLLTCLAFVGPAIAQQPTPTPFPAVEISPETSIPQGLSVQGFPQLGEADAPVRVTEYCAFDTFTCGTYFSEVFTALIPRIAAGEVRYTAALIEGTGEIPNGPGAARAALCAAEQGAFWPLRAALYAAQAEGGEAFRSDRLLAAVDAVALDRAAWDACMLSERPDALLEAASADANAHDGFSGVVPFVVVNGVPSLTDLDSVQASIDLELASAALTPAPDSGPEATEIPVVTLEPLLGERIEPPLDIELPAGWRSGYDALVLADVDGAIRSIPLAVYTGPVTGGQGFIVLLWGFPNIIPLAGSPEGPIQDLWADGLRLLRLAVIEQGCNIGTDLRTEYSVGGRPAMGTQFAAVDCPALPDTRGWFAGINERGVNFVFYVYTEPIDAMNTAESELQAVLDSVRFRVPDAEATEAVEP